MTAELDLTWRQGQTETVVLLWESAGNPVDLSGWSARMMLRTHPEAAASSLSLTSGSGITLGGVAGTVTIAVTATQTTALTARLYVYDLELVNGSAVTRLAEGSVTVVREVTR